MASLRNFRPFSFREIAFGQKEWKSETFSTLFSLSRLGHWYGRKVDADNKKQKLTLCYFSGYFIFSPLSHKNDTNNLLEISNCHYVHDLAFDFFRGDFPAATHLAKSKSSLDLEIPANESFSPNPKIPNTTGREKMTPVKICFRCYNHSFPFFSATLFNKSF